MPTGVPLSVAVEATSRDVQAILRRIGRIEKYIFLTQRLDGLIPYGAKNNNEYQLRMQEIKDILQEIRQIIVVCEEAKKDDGT